MSSSRSVLPVMLLLACAAMRSSVAVVTDEVRGSAFLTTHTRDLSKGVVDPEEIETNKSCKAHAWPGLLPAPWHRFMAAYWQPILAYNVVGFDRKPVLKSLTKNNVLVNNNKPVEFLAMCTEIEVIAKGKPKGANGPFAGPKADDFDVANFFAKKTGLGSSKGKPNGVVPGVSKEARLRLLEYNAATGERRISHPKHGVMTCREDSWYHKFNMLSAYCEVSSAGKTKKRLVFEAAFRDTRFRGVLQQMWKRDYIINMNSMADIIEQNLYLERNLFFKIALAATNSANAAPWVGRAIIGVAEGGLNSRCYNFGMLGQAFTAYIKHEERFHPSHRPAANGMGPLSSGPRSHTSQ